MAGSAYLIHWEQHVDQLQHAAIAPVWHDSLCQQRQQVWMMKLCHDLDFSLCFYQLLIASSQYL